MEMSSLLQIRITNEQLRGFVSPIAQPDVNPMNCGAVAGQLLKLVTPDLANTMTMSGMGMYVSEWVQHTSGLVKKQTYGIDRDIRTFGDFFVSMLFPGFATLVGTYNPVTNTGHFFVIGRFLNGHLVILDPQLRKGYLNILNYFRENRPYDTRFVAIVMEKQQPAAFYDAFSKYLSESVESSCDPNTKPYGMDVDVTPEFDVEMKLGGKRKRRKTRRRLLSKRTLRRMHRRR